MKPDIPADAFAGTASYYAEYRVPYPEPLLDDLIERSGVESGEGRLLDLACGPGRMALRLAPRFSETWAIDLEPEMVDVGKQEAVRCGVANLRWSVGRAEELVADPGSFALITIGEAFHRLDQRRITEQALAWLAPGCCLAIIGCNSLVSGKEPWHLIIRDVVRKWTSRRSASGKARARGGGPAHNIQVLKDAGFQGVENYSFVCPYDWTVESILGNLYSTSLCSKHVLGDSAGAFEADLREALLAHDACGRYPEQILFGFTLGRTPA